MEGGTSLYIKGNHSLLYPYFMYKNIKAVNIKTVETNNSPEKTYHNIIILQVSKLAAFLYKKKGDRIRS